MGDDFLRRRTTGFAHASDRKYEQQLKELSLIARSRPEVHNRLYRCSVKKSGLAEVGAPVIVRGVDAHTVTVVLGNVRVAEVQPGDIPDVLEALAQRTSATGEITEVSPLTGDLKIRLVLGSNNDESE